MVTIRQIVAAKGNLTHLRLDKLLIVKFAPNRSGNGPLQVFKRLHLSGDNEDMDLAPDIQVGDIALLFASCLKMLLMLTAALILLLLASIWCWRSVDSFRLSPTVASLNVDSGLMKSEPMALARGFDFAAVGPIAPEANAIGSRNVVVSKTNSMTCRVRLPVLLRLLAENISDCVPSNFKERFIDFHILNASDFRCAIFKLHPVVIFWYAKQLRLRFPITTAVGSVAGSVA